VECKKQQYQVVLFVKFPQEEIWPSLIMISIVQVFLEKNEQQYQKTIFLVFLEQHRFYL
jgi:hypothetical protein